MAAINLALLVLGIQYLSKITNQVTRKAPTYSLLPKIRGSGKNAYDVLRTTGAVISNTAEGSAAAAATVNAQVPFTMGFGVYDSTLEITEQAKRAAAANMAGPPTMGMSSTNALAEDAGLRVLEVLDHLNADLWVGAGGTEIVGFYDAIGDTANTYAGINRATLGNEYWHPNVFDDGVPTAATRALVEGDLTGIQVNGFKPGRPDLIIANPTIFDSVAGSLQGNIAYNVTLQNPADPNRLVVQASIDAIKFGSALMIQDEDAPDDAITYINTEYVKLVYLPYSDEVQRAIAAMPPAVLAALREFMAMAGLSDNMLPLDMNFKQLGVTGQQDSYNLACFPALCVTRPNACGMRLNVVPS